ncbi:MAG: hypothetical protein WKF58_18990 [Ilumatobacteraceae bacterium]
MPAFMKLAGEANWWAPGPLRRLHDRFGIREGGDDEPDAELDGEHPTASRTASRSTARTAIGDAPGTCIDV